MQRRELFGSLAKPFKNRSLQEKAIRPPYFKDINLFFTKCLECLEKPCSTSCEENIIEILEDGTPKKTFQILVVLIVTYVQFLVKMVF